MVRRDRGGGRSAARPRAEAPAPVSSSAEPRRSRLEIVPLTFREAVGFVAEHHRHHPPPPGDLFRLGVVDEAGQLRGVAIVGRPTARHLDDGRTAEVVRVATDGCPNACSALYGAAWRAARALGWRRLITFTLVAEGGASLRGAGWRAVGERADRSWAESSVARKRYDRHTARGQKTLWEAGP
jgi:hypothetical protein